MLNKLTELAKEIDQSGMESEEEEGDYGLFNKEELETFLKEIEKTCKEKEISEEQINANRQLKIKLRSRGLSNYQELIRKEVFSQEKLEE